MTFEITAPADGEPSAAAALETLTAAVASGAKSVGGFSSVGALTALAVTAAAEEEVVRDPTTWIVLQTKWP